MNYNSEVDEDDYEEEEDDDAVVDRLGVVG